MPKCPKCNIELGNPSKEWRFGSFNVKMFKCSNCGNRYREYFRNGALRFVLSEHNKTLNTSSGARRRIKR